MPKIGAYLATPYSHEDPAVKQWRYERVTEAAALLLRSGTCIVSIYSPITHTHPIDHHMREKQNEHTFWVEKFDMPFLANSEKVIVLMLPGWDKSIRVKMEVQKAKELGIPVSYAVPRYDEMFRIIDVKQVTGTPEVLPGHEPAPRMCRTSFLEVGDNPCSLLT